MTKRLECIKSLKNKLIEMQRDLERIEAEPLRHKTQFYEPENLSFNRTLPLSNYNSMAAEPTLTKSPTWKNPTFWGSNPLLGREVSPKAPSKWNKSKSPRNIKLELSNEKKQLKHFGDQNYYDRTIDPTLHKPVVQKNKSQRYLYSFQNNQSETPRFQKIKTFNHPPSNPILNPELPKEKGKKIVLKIPTSPTLNLVQNPRSNPSLYFFNDKMIALSPKSNNAKNLSPQMRQLLSSSLQEKICSPKRKSSKKHYARYFKETYECKWN